MLSNRNECASQQGLSDFSLTKINNDGDFIGARLSLSAPEAMHDKVYKNFFLITFKAGYTRKTFW